MTTPSDKETSIEKDATPLSLQHPLITLTSKAKDTKEYRWIHDLLELMDNSSTQD